MGNMVTLNNIDNILIIINIINNNINIEIFQHTSPYFFAFFFELAKQVMQQIQQETRDLNPNYNLDTLAIFATPQQAKVLRFPFNTAERVIVGEQFAVRDLLRNMASAVHYYAVVVTREKGRLIEATDDRVIHEFTASDNPSIELPHGPFPVVTDSLATTSVAERASNEDIASDARQFEKQRRRLFS